ncbi:MAG: AAA family ATPase [Thalassococcus sp.]|uniref:AAA family ATPase n=1 Tax=Thalassococcus sp. TaxID=1928858 RepID=UPI001B2805BA|nr:AAA family ATPase [Thalassococcus sp.]MBO6867378.1 AAA family ATPase [Thalassococcus sp.]
MTSISVEQLAKEITDRATGDGRFVVAVAGPPGAGKSTLSEALVDRLGDIAAVLPMDGFHMDNADLIELGLLPRKGAPETFHAEAFGELLSDVRTQDTVDYPTFDRSMDRTVPNGGRIEQHTRIIVAEGNYLLLKDKPWDRLASMFDMTVLLEVPRDVLEARLVQRWLDHDMSEADAIARARGNDMVNVDTVINRSGTPDFRVGEAG